MQTCNNKTKYYTRYKTEKHGHVINNRHAIGQYKTTMQAVSMFAVTYM